MREPLGRRPALRVDEQGVRPPSRARAPAGRGGASRAGRRPRWIRREVSSHVAAPERMLAGERLPEQDADRPDVCGRGRRQALQALGRDVGERSRDVARAQSACRTRPSAPARSRGVARRRRPVRVQVLRQQDVRRLHVAVDDPACRGHARALRRSARRPRSPRGRRARPPASPRAGCGPGCTRRRCRRGLVAGQRRGSAGSAGWRSEAAARASRSARCPDLPSRATIFSATSRPLRSSRASQTWPMPPAPSGRSGR